MPRTHVSMGDAGITPRSVTRRDALRLFMGAGICATFFPAVARAETTQEKLDAAQMSFEDAQAELNRIGQETAEVAGRLSETQVQISELNAQIDQTQADIESKQEEIDERQAEIEEKQERLGDRMTSAYKSGAQGTLDLILSATTFDELTTLLHEFGHALHGIMARGDYESLNGTNVCRDFVELPSQMTEYWATEKEYLDMWAVHYATGEPMPAELVGRIVAAKNYLAAYANIRQVSFGLIDMAWHTLREPWSGDVEAFEREASRGVQVARAVEGTAMSSSFTHIFAGGYAAGYYGYKWSEVLAADAFSLFRERGVFDSGAAAAFRHLLEQGDQRPAMDLYVEFRGHRPATGALIREMGLGNGDARPDGTTENG